MANGVSAIICCYNSSPRLQHTLMHLARQKFSGFGFEIIVVDNASTDNTAALAGKLLNNCPGINYVIVNEPESGLSFARKKGYNTAKYDFLLYCDDDNWLAENYVALTYNTMMANPKIGILGGLGEAVFETLQPAWFRQYEFAFAVGEQSASQEALSQVNEVYGAGFTIRKSYLDKLYSSGFKSILSDRKGNQLISGGDSELCFMARFFGYEIWYNRELNFKHLMTTGRMNWGYLKRLYDGFGRSQAYMKVYRHMQEGKQSHKKNLRLPFWLDTLVHKVKYIVAFYPKVFGKMNEEGNPDVLRFRAMLGEASEIWKLKQKYSDLFDKVLANQNAGHK